MIKMESFHIKELKVRRNLLGINASFYGKIAGHPMYWLYCDNKLRSWMVEMQPWIISFEILNESIS